MGSYTNVYDFPLEERAPVHVDAHQLETLGVPPDYWDLWSETCSKLERELQKKDLLGVSEL